MEPRLHLRLYFDDIPFGPGKAALLRHIAEQGSISAAGRAMGMSYKRAWDLVEEMNALFAAPLVATARGGAAKGGATVTPAGQEVLTHYRALMDLVAGQGAGHLAAISGLLAPRLRGDSPQDPAPQD
ncbi:LysR family transcriptional regulator [Rhodobacter sp. KR11]|uniref:winged helix-turn-helix domain-containing protein n=1 Tax=Rhodobacter sp. KR11 TaxID=2974588 RepID=UPI0022222E50|nr:LysR family transcriptional regulator [Rhodobacter sp. KR11]MCW1917731.1 LysR family transcriptional regulator [Rhodobacter sp. KR11]